MKNFMKHDFLIGEITFADVVKAGTGALVHKNRQSHGIALFLGGKRTISFDNKKITVGKNTIVYFPKGSNYTIKETESFDCYAINFQMPDDTVFEPFSFNIINANEYLESFKKARKIRMKNVIGSNTKIKAELYNIIYNMQTEYSLPYINSANIEPAIKYIHSNYYKENISISYLSNLCNISEVHLRNTFIRKFAVSPLKYINNLKMSRAKELLSSQFYSISEVCFLSGYNDESYFCREFKKYFGQTPSDFMKQIRN